VVKGRRGRRVVLIFQHFFTKVKHVSPETRQLTIYFLGWDPQHQDAAVWRLPTAGGALQPLVRFDDPASDGSPHGCTVRHSATVIP
jgi:hypothetical protein